MARCAVLIDGAYLDKVLHSPNSRHDELLQACDERYEITRDLIEKTKLATASVSSREISK
jgi:hypothetical protein